MKTFTTTLSTARLVWVSTEPDVVTLQTFNGATWRSALTKFEVPEDTLTDTGAHFDKLGVWMEAKLTAIEAAASTAV